jgi:hypothetical protein
MLGVSYVYENGGLHHLQDGCAPQAREKSLRMSFEFRNIPAAATSAECHGRSQARRCRFLTTTAHVAPDSDMGGRHRLQAIPQQSVCDCHGADALVVHERQCAEDLLSVRQFAQIRADTDGCSSPSSCVETIGVGPKVSDVESTILVCGPDPKRSCHLRKRAVIVRILRACDVGAHLHRLCPRRLQPVAVLDQGKAMRSRRTRPKRM